MLRRVWFAQPEATYKEGDGSAWSIILLLTIKELELAQPREESFKSDSAMKPDKQQDAMGASTTPCECHKCRSCVSSFSSHKRHLESHEDLALGWVCREEGWNSAFCKAHKADYSRHLKTQHAFCGNIPEATVVVFYTTHPGVNGRGHGAMMEEDGR